MSVGRASQALLVQWQRECATQISSPWARRLRLAPSTHSLQTVRMPSLGITRDCRGRLSKVARRWEQMQPHGACRCDKERLQWLRSDSWLQRTTASRDFLPTIGTSLSGPNPQASRGPSPMHRRGRAVQVIAAPSVSALGLTLGRFLRCLESTGVMARMESRGLVVT